MTTEMTEQTDVVPVPGKAIPDGTKIPDRFSDLYRLLPHDENILIFDIGANVGDMTIKFRDMYPLSTIHCFEPTPEAFKKLRWRFKEDAQVKLNNVAVSDANGTKKFFVNEEYNKVNSLLQRNQELSKYYRYDVKKHIEVKTIALGPYCNANKIQKVNLLKLDIQGGEIYALKGAVEILKRKKVDVLLTEVLFVELYEGGAVFFELSAFLAQYGYTLYNLYDLHRAEGGQLTWGDGIFISQDYRKKVFGEKTNFFKQLFSKF